MKKLFLFFALLAGIAVMTGCQKDQDVVTLKAAIDQDTKAYFSEGRQDAQGNYLYDLPYWNTGDQAKVNGTVKRLTFPGNTITTFASIEGVDESNYYAAIFPADAAETMYAPGGDGTTHAVVYFRPDQVYKEVTVGNETHQQVDMIMGAVANNTTKTLIFKNLCSILRLNIVNDLGRTVKLSRITVQATGAYVSGSADVTLTQNGTPVVLLDDLNDHSHDNVLSIYAPKDQNGHRVFMKTLTASGSTSIDVVVPPFDANSLNIELELYEADGTTCIGNSDAIIDNPPSLDINKIVPINLTTNHRFEIIDYAYLESGPKFHNHMTQLLATLPTGAIANNLTVTRLWYRPNGWTPPAGAKNVEDDGSPFEIWAYLQNVPAGSNTYQITILSEAKLIYAHKDCSQMFEGLPVSTMNWNNSSDPANPQGFQTEDVVDMSSMFKNCSNLSSIEGANFNTTNVRTMASMFEGCSSLSSPEDFLGTFNTHNLQDMEAMFMGCSDMSEIDLGHFVTRRVTDMSDLFNGCSKLKTIHIDQFDMRSVTDKARMFLNIGTFSEGNNTIHCTDPTWTAIQTGTNLPSNTTQVSTGTGAK